MDKFNWDETSLATLMDTYPVETTAYTASRLGISERMVRNKAGELGLAKFRKSKWMERAEYIRNNFHESSFSEMAAHLGISKAHVGRIASRLGLKRTKAELSRVASRIRKEIIRREKRHVVFGLEPVTRVKVVSNRTKVRIRAQLKSKGYIVGEERDILYYTTEASRRTGLEARGRKQGLRFYPYRTVMRATCAI